MNKVLVGAEATIITGKCTGISGIVIGADSEMNTVEIRIEDGVYITTTYEKITQG